MGMGPIRVKDLSDKAAITFPAGDVHRMTAYNWRKTFTIFLAGMITMFVLMTYGDDTPKDPPTKPKTSTSQSGSLGGQTNGGMSDK